MKSLVIGATILSVMQPAVTNAQQWAAPAGAKTYRTYATDDGSIVFCRSKAGWTNVIIATPPMDGACAL